MNKKTLYNVITGFGSQIIIIILGLIVPRFVLVNYGSDTNGLTSTVTQIFTYMALLEAGIGQATRNALYKHIKQGDRNSVSFVMSVSRRYYRKVTVYYGIGVILLAMVLPLVIKSHISYWTIFFVALFEGLTQVVAFWFTQNWMQLLMASGENYIRVNAELIGRVAGYGLKILLASIGINIAIVQGGYFVISMIKLAYYKKYMDTHYGWIDYDMAPVDAVLKDRNAYILTEIAWTIFSSTDMIILSMFYSTELASVYAIYNMVFSNINSLLNSVYQGTQYILGQTFFKNRAEYCRIHDAYNSIFLGTMTILMSVAYILIIPFVKLYTKGITDIDYVYKWLPLGFCLVQIISWSRYIAGNLTGIAGYAKVVSKISLVEALTNLILSFVLLWKYGIVGVIFATVIALPLKAIYVTWLTEKKILERRMTRTITILFSNYCLFAIVVIVNERLQISISSFGEFLINGLILTPILAIIGMLINILANPSFPKVFTKIKKRDSNK